MTSQPRRKANEKLVHTYHVDICATAGLSTGVLHFVVMPLVWGVRLNYSRVKGKLPHKLSIQLGPIGVTWAVARPRPTSKFGFERFTSVTKASDL